MNASVSWAADIRADSDPGNIRSRSVSEIHYQDLGKQLPETD